MDLATRLKNFIISLGLANSEFADRAGIPRPTLSQLLTGRNKSVNDAFIKKIHDAFPTLNIAWLLFNEGDMVIASNIQISDAQNEENLDGIEAQSANNQDGNNSNSSDLFNSDLFTEKSDILNNKNINTTEYNSSTSNLIDATNSGLINELAVAKDTPTDIGLHVDKLKRVNSIMVFYSDNSFEIFKPADK
jgi:transcriptional regulator with XRE-family HTH domain